MEFNWVEPNSDNYITTISKKSKLKHGFGKENMKQVSLNKDEATPIDLHVNCYIHREQIKDVVNQLIAARKRGENVYCEVVQGATWQSEFDKSYQFEIPAVRLYSADVTYRSALVAMARRDEIELGLLRTGESAEVKHLIAQKHDWQVWELRGRIAVLTMDDTKEKIWAKYVEKCVSYNHKFAAIKQMVKVMECVCNNGTAKDVKKILDATYGLDWEMVMHGIKMFCPNGKKMVADIVKLYQAERRQMQQNQKSNIQHHDATVEVERVK